MKKVLFKKLLSDYLGFFFITLVSTSVVIWVFQAVNYLDIMIEDGRDYLVYVNFSLLNFPKIISKVNPFALFFSLFYVTSKSEFNNELIILWNFGVHKIEIVNFFLKISIILVIFQILFTSILVPIAQDTARSFLRTSTINFFDNFIKPQKFNDTIKGVTIYSEKKDENGNLTNLYLKKDVENGFQVTYAKKGQFQQIANTPILVLYDGATITSENNGINNIAFSKSDFSLSNIETNTTTYKKTQELSSSKLIKCTKDFYKLKKEEFILEGKKIENCSYANIPNILRELYKRFIIPFYIPLLSLIPLILITSSKESPSYNKLRLITFLIGLGVIIFSEATIKLISNILLYDAGMAIIPFIMFLFLYLFLFNKFHFKAKL